MAKNSEFRGRGAEKADVRRKGMRGEGEVSMKLSLCRPVTVCPHLYASSTWDGFPSLWFLCICVSVTRTDGQIKEKGEGGGGLKKGAVTVQQQCDSIRAVRELVL